jgi:hypothetical protein
MSYIAGVRPVVLELVVVVLPGGVELQVLGLEYGIVFDGGFDLDLAGQQKCHSMNCVCIACCRATQVLIPDCPWLLNREKSQLDGRKRCKVYGCEYFQS